eukprot:GEMP01055579.1.p1 GENE.GEMP01055579.1~~GEMP01055579.1.p1  ORF type:complete len:167 (+),score=33.13 GEMP01055579.1:307-807(+)
MAELDDLDALLSRLEEPLSPVVQQAEPLVSADETDQLDQLLGEMLSDSDGDGYGNARRDSGPRPGGKCDKPWVHKDGKGCNNLRCMKCDFAVMHFENAAWAEGTDYLFFRNFHPNSDKLQRRLHKRKGCVASCCQCNWRTLECTSLGIELREAPPDGEGYWACFGH